MLESLLMLSAFEQSRTNAKKRAGLDMGSLLLAAAMAGRQHSPRRLSRQQQERRRLRRLTLLEFSRDHYLPGRDHGPDSSTAELARWALGRLRQCMGRDVLVKEITPALLDRFRHWLAAQVAAGSR